MFKIFIGFNHKGTYLEGWFVKWNNGIANWTADQNNYFGGTEYTAINVLIEWNKLITHYQPLQDNKTITDLKLEIHYGQNNIVSPDFVKEKIKEQVKNAGAKASFDPRQLTDDEKLAIFYMAQYIIMQEDSNANRSVLFRDFVTDNLPDTMKIETDGIVKGIGNLSTEILGNQKDTLIPDDEPYIKITNGGI